MDFIDKLRELSTKAQSAAENTTTEEAAKTAMVLPFLQVLGYDIFDPTEVVPEFVADVGHKKGEKVDYAIIRDSKPILLIECKSPDLVLTNENASQLYRYFSNSSARFGILTNGTVYQFFSDLDEPNKMDLQPFMEVNMLEQITPRIAEHLKVFCKESYNERSTISTATSVKYDTAIKRLLADQLDAPSEEFIRFVLMQVYKGKKTKRVQERFAKIVKEGMRGFVNEQVQQRLQKAMTGEEGTKDGQSSPSAENGSIRSRDEAKDGQDLASSKKSRIKSKIVTTEDEKMGLYIVKSILLDQVEKDRIVLSDHVPYCNILLDGDSKRLICRLRFTSKTKTVEIPKGKKVGERLPIDNVNGLYDLRDLIKERAAWLLHHQGVEKQR